MEINNLYYKMITNPKILVVDDSATNNLLIQSILADQGYEVNIATNGKEALKFISEEKFDLILLDIMMPKMNGFEVLEKLKDDNETSRIPVIVITAKVETKDVKRAIELGAIDYIKKPIDIDEIISRSNMALRLKHVADESRNVNEVSSHLINTLIKGFLYDHFKTINSEKVDKSELSKTINSFVSNVFLNNILLKQYKPEISSANIIDLINQIFILFSEKIVLHNIVLEKNYSGKLFSKTDTKFLTFCFLFLFNHLFNSQNAKIVVSIYNSNKNNIIKIYDSNNSTPSNESKQINDKIFSLFKLINVQFNVFENSVSGNEYEIIIG